MLWILFTFFAGVHLTLFVLSFRLRSGLAEWLVRFLLLGLMTDNLILAAGAVAIEAPWYYVASEFRYVAHVILLPPLVIAGLELLRRAGSVVAARSIALAAATAFVVAAIGYGIATEVVGLELVRETLLGHSRYTSAHGGPPLATIAINLVILGMAAALWRVGRFPWLFVAALAIFIVNGATATSDWGIIGGNLAEILFICGWLASCRRFGPD
jgi:hypothetical protein